jgi:TonB-linked SusC/RagA family outer membrane protein
MFFFTIPKMGYTITTHFSRNSSWKYYSKQFMRISFIALALMFTSCTMLMALSGKSQDISKIEVELRFENEPILSALKKIERKIPFRFVFRKALLNEITPRNLTEGTYTLEQALTKLLANTGLSYKQVNENLLIVAEEKKNEEIIISEEVAETGIINGRITDSKGQIIPGVSIKLAGAVTQTRISDVNGKYSFNNLAQGSYTVTFLYIGYKKAVKELTLRKNQVLELNVELDQETNGLDEVVVVGYGSMKKALLSGAQTTITAEQIGKTINTTVEQAIQGRSAGVFVTQNSGQPGGAMSINIRGLNSVNGTNEPLYVIDGVQSQPGFPSYGPTSSVNPMAGLNPSDVETIDILQGPSATAIYGSRATNGVVLITTKRGKAGDMKIRYTYGATLQSRPKTLPVMNLMEFATMVNEMLPGNPTDPELIDPSILGDGTNWQEALFKNSLLSKHQLMLSGGSDKTTFYLSGEYLKQDGVAIGSAFDRYNLRLNLDSKARNWIKLSSNINVNQTNEKLTSTADKVITDAIQLAPKIPVKNADGTWGGPEDRADGQDEYYPINPVAIANLTTNDLLRRAATGGLSAELNVLKGLIFRTTLNGSISYSTFDRFVPTYKIGSRSNDVATLSVSDNQSTYVNFNQLLQYNRSFNKHTLGLMISHESQVSNYRALSGARQGFITNDIPDLNIGNAVGATNGGGKGDWAQESYFGRLNYAYNNKYILQAAIRSDGSSNFGSNNRWGVFPSASVAWRVSEEPFMKHLTFISDLKLRYEIGITGNQGSRGIFAEMNTVHTPWGSGFNVSRYGNEDLKWEETKTNNFGFNLSVLKNRIDLEGDFYFKQTDNMLMVNPLPNYMGTYGQGSIGSPIVNIGSLNNRGFGITLNAVVVDNKQLNWKLNLNVSRFKTKLTKLNTDAAFMDRSMMGLTERSVVGQVPWLMYGYVYDGIFQSIEEINKSAIPVAANGSRLPVQRISGVYVGDIKFKDLNADGIIDDRDQRFIGNPWPKFTAGFTNSISYKNFDLSILLIGTFGNDIYNAVRVTNTQPVNIYTGRNMLKETYNYARIAMDPANNPYLTNPETNIPRVTWGSDVNGNTRSTGRLIEDGSYIRIKNVQLGYTLSKKLLARQPFVKGATFSVAVQNLATFTKYTGYDPEIGNFVGPDAISGTQLTGLDGGRYPLTRMFNFNVSLNF